MASSTLLQRSRYAGLLISVAGVLSLAPRAAADDLIDIVDGVVLPGPQRDAPGSEHFLAWDGDVNTRTFSTNSGTQTAPQRTLLDLEDDGHVLSRIRINDVADNDNNGRMRQITVRVTTDTDADLSVRSYTDVTNLTVSALPDDAPTAPNVTVTGATVEHLDTLHDGFYSLTFDPVANVTGIEFEWENDGPNKHWTIREIEAYSAGTNDPNLVVAPVGVELAGPDTITIPISNSGTTENLHISNAEITGGAQQGAFSNVQFPAEVLPGGNGTIEVDFDPGDEFGSFAATLTITSDDESDPTVDISLEVTRRSAGEGTLIDIVDGVVLPGPQRDAAGSEHFLAWDGDVNTRTFSTNSGTQTAPQRTLLDLEEGGHLLSRIRINDIADNDNNGRMQQITVRLTTDPDADLSARTYTDVTGLMVLALSDDAATAPNVNVTGATIEHLDTLHDGFYSITFDPVPDVTGIELEWANEGPFKHWTIREIEAYATTSTEDPNLVVASQVNVELPDAGTILIRIRNGGQSQDLNISNVAITGGAQQAAFSNVQFPAQLIPDEVGTVEVDFDPGNTIGDFQGILTISSDDPSDPEKTVTINVNRPEPPVPTGDTLVDIVAGLVAPGPGRTANNPPENAFDGDVATHTFMTESATQTAPQHTYLDLDDGIHNLSRIRINDVAGNDNNGRMLRIVIRVTTDTNPDLADRAYNDVTNMAVQKFDGDAEPLPNVIITGNSIEHLDTFHDGFYSITFDPVPNATGIEIEWENEGPFKHWTVREIEAYSGTAPGPAVRITDISYNDFADSISISWESKDGNLYNLRSETDLAVSPTAEWPIVGDNQNVVATPPENTVTFARPADPSRYYVIECFPAPPVSIFSENFDAAAALPPDWNTGTNPLDTGTTMWQFGTPSVVGPGAANSPPNCAATNLAADYGLETDIYLRTPPVDLTTAAGATVSFWHFVDAEITWDFGQVRVLDVNDDSELAVLLPRADGNAVDWSQFSAKVPPSALGKSVRIEFRFSADDVNNQSGWYIDDVEITVP